MDDNYWRKEGQGRGHGRRSFSCEENREVRMTETREEIRVKIGKGGGGKVGETVESFPLGILTNGYL